MAPLFWGMGDLCQRDCFVECEGNSPYGIPTEPVNILLVVAQCIEEHGHHPGPFLAFLVEHLLLGVYRLFHIVCQLPLLGVQLAERIFRTVELRGLELLCELGELILDVIPHGEHVLLQWITAGPGPG